jgi:hypothetical protein
VGGRISLGIRVLGAMMRILLDRLAESAGRALPRTPEQLADADTITALFQTCSPRGAPPMPPVQRARLTGVDFESSNCTNFLVDLEFDVAASRSESLPQSVYAKLPCKEFATRAFANAVGFWDTEVAFCKTIASRVPIRVPRVYAAEKRGARFVLLLENLREVSGIRLFTNRDMAAGTTPERARMCLRTFAELHAAFWDFSVAEREAILPVRLHTYLSPGGPQRTRALNASAINPAYAKAPDIFTQEHVALCRMAIDKWDALMEAWYGGPLTLIHGDSHLANCFEYPSPDGPRMGLLDFQGVQWCKGIRDAQYFLINSLSPEILAAHEAELINDYICALGEYGVTLSREDAHEQYRACSFQTLMVAVVSLGLGSLTERDETVRTILERSVAAIDRLDFGEWLEAL